MRATDRAKYVAQHETPDGEHVGALSPYQDVPHPIGADACSAWTLYSRSSHFAKKNIHAANGTLLERGIVTLRIHNGWDGLPNEAPFHYIHVGAAADVPPQALMDQLADGGRRTARAPVR
ncbi:hypothetical protein PsorP6_018843 [Peronosclerospora sorghi]|nr:hypothetical protein PsorP6_018843 [Peronosclerospora sorghi]